MNSNSASTAPHPAPKSDSSAQTLRIATWNIHKGVSGVGPMRRLHIHDIGHAIEQFDADVVCLQEVRNLLRRGPQHFKRWPTLPQSDFLAPVGYEAVYRTNATTAEGEHGNALLSRWPVQQVMHESMSDHRFEQRGLLHVQLLIDDRTVHVLVVHLGLIHGSRVRQTQQLLRYIGREIPVHEPLLVAGDFNDWTEKLHDAFKQGGLHTFDGQRLATFPARLPLLQLDRVYARGLTLLAAMVPHGRIWRRMSDHLPLVAEFRLAAT